MLALFQTFFKSNIIIIKTTRHTELEKGTLPINHDGPRTRIPGKI